MKMNYAYGLKRGIPIALGYLSVSFGFGISAISSGLSPREATLISLFNITSAGQMAGISVISAMGSVVEMILSQLIINIRYSLMGIALTQKLVKNYSFLHRCATAFSITDEVFVMAASETNEITPLYMYGLITLPILGWVSGTALGAYMGQVMPEAVRNALGISIYSMFTAIIIPPARENSAIALAIAIASAISCILYYIPPLHSAISSGFAIIICALISAGIIAKLFPSKESEAQEYE